MNKKEHYLTLLRFKKLDTKIEKLIANQIERFFMLDKYNIRNKYCIGDDVFLKKGTLLHGTYKNIDGLKNIVRSGLITGNLLGGRISKYPFTVSVWNLQQDWLLKDYIDYYSGGTIRYNNHLNGEKETEIIPHSKIPFLMQRVREKGFLSWQMEQTKEARFLPSYVQDHVQIGIIFNGEHPLLQVMVEDADVLNPKTIPDDIAKMFVAKAYADAFMENRKNKDDFFTNRESAIVFGIPSIYIEGILVGREYENNPDILREIKELLPNCYVCNLDGKVIL